MLVIHICVLTLLVAVIAIGTVASANTIMPERLVGGFVYRQIVAKEKKLLAMHNTLKGIPIKSFNTSVNYFQQLMDHTTPSTKTFTQRYFYDLGNYSGGKTAMIYINGEGPVSSSPFGFVQDLAYSMGSAIFTIEHRYYGDSLPSPLTEKETLMKLLNVENALADLIYFMKYAEKKYLGGDDITWYAAGGSYSGALSSWLREMYPSNVAAAWSSSGVINTIFDFSDFDGSIVNVIPTECASAISNVYNIISEQYDDVNTRQQLLNKMGTPSYFTKADIGFMIADGAAMMVQYGQKASLCNTILPPTSDPVAQFIGIIKSAWGEDFTSNCYYSTECLSNESYSSQWSSAGYSWVYQCCSQLAYWQTGYPRSLRLRDVSVDYFINQCRAAFTPDIIPDTFSFNRKFGGLQTTATKVIATQGSDDPWQWAGAMNDLGPEYPMVMAQCEGCGHCGDMGPSYDPNHSKQQSAVSEYMNKWVKETAEKVKKLTEMGKVNSKK